MFPPRDVSYVEGQLILIPSSAVGGPLHRSVQFIHPLHGLLPPHGSILHNMPYLSASLAMPSLPPPVVSSPSTFVESGRGSVTSSSRSETNVGTLSSSPTHVDGNGAGSCTDTEGEATTMETENVDSCPFATDEEGEDTDPCPSARCDVSELVTSPEASGTMSSTTQRKPTKFDILVRSIENQEVHQEKMIVQDPEMCNQDDAIIFAYEENPHYVAANRKRKYTYKKAKRSRKKKKFQ